MNTINAPASTPGNGNGRTKPLTIALIIGGAILLGLAVVIVSCVVLVNFLSNTKIALSPASKLSELTAYLNDKYGAEVEFIDTGERGGGGIGIDHHIVYYTTDELGDRQFSVTYGYKDHEITSICDNYLEAKFADDLENLFASFFNDLGIKHVNAKITVGTGCDSSAPTDNFYDYLRDENAFIFTPITIQNDPAHPIDKESVANAMIDYMRKLGVPEKPDKISNTYTRVTVVNDECDYMDVIACPKTNYVEYFWISPEGYEDIDNPAKNRNNS